MLTVQDLYTQLRQLPPEARVVLRDPTQPGCYVDLMTLAQVPLDVAHPETMSGEYQVYREGCADSCPVAISLQGLAHATAVPSAVPDAVPDADQDEVA